MRASILPAIAIMAATACLVACETTSSKAPAEWDGLQRREVKGLDNVYVRPNVQFTPYEKVMLDPVQVEFSKDWDPNTSRDISRHLDAQDLQNIKQGLAAMVLEDFSKELTAGGYALVSAPADDTLRVSCAIVNLYINAPDTMSAGRSRTYTTEAGYMTFVMELRDSVRGQLLARVVDTRSSGDVGHLQWTNSVTNRADADRMISAWAKYLRDGLDRLKGKTS